MSDAIYVNGITCFAYHGVLEEETRLGQQFVIDLKLSLNLKASGLSDDLTQTVNYADVMLHVQKIATDHTFKLIETLAETIADFILKTYALVKKVCVKVTKKPAVPITFDTVAVEIKRERKLLF